MMALDYKAMLAARIEGAETQYNDKDVLLYALGVGMGADPMNRDELPFVYEKGLKVLPTFATVVPRGRGGNVIGGGGGMGAAEVAAAARCISGGTAAQGWGGDPRQGQPVGMGKLYGPIHAQRLQRVGWSDALPLRPV